MNDELIKLLLSTIGKELSADQPVSEKRRAEYHKLFGELGFDVEEAYRTMNAKTTSDLLIGSYVKRIFDSNPEIETYRKNISIVAIDSNRENTKTILIEKDRHIITFDSHIMKFIWMMNKGFLYGGLSLSIEDNLQLFYELFLHFGSIVASDYQCGFPKPDTPKHSDLSTYMILHKYTEIQEIFLLSHEIAHILIKNDDYAHISEVVSSSNYSLKDVVDVDNPEAINEEILADEIALDLTLNAYDKNVPEVVEIVCSAVFAIVRYFLWLRIVYKRQEEDYDFHVWFTRNNFMRTKFRQVYRWGEPVFIVDMLEAMEERMEPAALAAAETIKEILREIKETG